PVDNWGDFSAKNVGSKPVTCNEEAPKGSRYAKADFSGFGETAFIGGDYQLLVLVERFTPPMNARFVALPLGNRLSG
ncbi:MAG: hypothetical protein ACREPR_11960, partial [Brasilonema sp.]